MGCASKYCGHYMPIVVTVALHICCAAKLSGAESNSGAWCDKPDSPPAFILRSPVFQPLEAKYDNSVARPQGTWFLPTFLDPRVQWNAWLSASPKDPIYSSVGVVETLVPEYNQDWNEIVTGNLADQEIFIEPIWQALNDEVEGTSAFANQGELRRLLLALPSYEQAVMVSPRIVVGVNPFSVESDRYPVAYPINGPAVYDLSVRFLTSIGIMDPRGMAMSFGFLRGSLKDRLSWYVRQGVVLHDPWATSYAFATTSNLVANATWFRELNNHDGITGHSLIGVVKNPVADTLKSSLQLFRQGYRSSFPTYEHWSAAFHSRVLLYLFENSDDMQTEFLSRLREALNEADAIPSQLSKLLRENNQASQPAPHVLQFTTENIDKIAAATRIYWLTEIVQQAILAVWPWNKSFSSDGDVLPPLAGAFPNVKSLATQMEALIAPYEPELPIRQWIFFKEIARMTRLNRLRWNGQEKPLNWLVHWWASHMRAHMTW